MKRQILHIFIPNLFILSGAILNGTLKCSSVSNCSLLVHKINLIVFLLTLYLGGLLNSLIGSSNFFAYFLVFSTQAILSSMNKDFFFASLNAFHFFSLPYHPGQDLQYDVKQEWQSGQPHLVQDFRGKLFTIKNDAGLLASSQVFCHILLLQTFQQRC